MQYDCARRCLGEHNDNHEAEEEEEEDTWSRSTETDAYSPPVRNDDACPPHTPHHHPTITPPEQDEDPELDRGCVMFAACHICAVSRNST